MRLVAVSLSVTCIFSFIGRIAVFYLTSHVVQSGPWEVHIYKLHVFAEAMDIQASLVFVVVAARLQQLSQDLPVDNFPIISAAEEAEWRSKWVIVSIYLCTSLAT